MSRSQQTQVFNTARGENAAYNKEAQTSFDTSQRDIGDYASAVGAFRAANPYVQGGQAQTLENQQLSDTAAGQAEAAGQALQSAAVRTGQNPAGAIAATENMQTRNARDLAAEEAAATERRLAAGTGYQEAGLEGIGQTEQMQNRLAEEQGQLAQGALGIAAKAGETPSFMDTLGSSFGSTFGKFLGDPSNIAKLFKGGGGDNSQGGGGSNG